MFSLSFTSFVFFIPAFGLVVLCAVYWRHVVTKKVFSSPRNEKAGGTPQGQPDIEPLPDFDWETTDPMRHRPFKPIYYITMALKSALPSELIIIDRNYLSRIQKRRQTMTAHEKHAMGYIPAGAEAIREVYTYLLGHYLPARYPSIFSRDEKTFHNSVTKRSFPLIPPDDPMVVLRSIGETVEDDIFLLRETPEGHQCTAFLCCSPSGFDPAEKLGKVLEEIHKPVPSYEKIGPSMERFFRRVEVGKSASRVNWSVTTHDELFNLASNHVKAGDEIEQDQEVDITKTHVRMELQTLTRLPQTRALLFSFKTYLYPLREIKQEGLGPSLADAVEGLKSGNAPGMWVYKGGIRWGKSVCEYLRS
ncbi:hypothetical protein F4778DRAFT_793459 [Xylariomycetidae sp. FL2044]|nr:hypothetical protein F4778DRAFT_793459 [Xylariomycetidae sp. FL2044]